MKWFLNHSLNTPLRSVVRFSGGTGDGKVENLVDGLKTVDLGPRYCQRRGALTVIPREAESDLTQMTVGRDVCEAGFVGKGRDDLVAAVGKVGSDTGFCVGKCGEDQ